MTVTAAGALRAGALKRPSIRRRGGRRARLDRRTLLGMISLIIVFSVILFGAVAYIGTAGQGKFLFGGQGEALPVDEAPARRIASILLVPWSGKTCEERRFDNHTGRIVSEEHINCEAKIPELNAAFLGDQEVRARMTAIINAFRR
jgi:hypothetical protein